MKHLIPQNLNYLMKKKQLSSARLFKQLEFKSSLISEKQLAAFKEGRNSPNIDIIRDLAKFFNLSIEDFCYTDLKALDESSIQTSTVKNLDNDLYENYIKSRSGINK